MRYIIGSQFYWIAYFVCRSFGIGWWSILIAALAQAALFSLMWRIEWGNWWFK